MKANGFGGLARGGLSANGSQGQFIADLEGEEPNTLVAGLDGRESKSAWRRRGCRAPGFRPGEVPLSIREDGGLLSAAGARCWIEERGTDHDVILDRLERLRQLVAHLPASYVKN